MVNRIGTRTGFDSMMGLMQQTLKKTTDIQIQISSGLKSQSFSGIANVAGRLVNFEAAKSRLNQYQSDITVTKNRLKLAETQIDSMRDMANQFRSDLLNAMNAGNDQFQPTTEIARQFLDQVQNLLNVKDGDQYIFSGSRTDVAPVDITAFSTALDVNTPNTEYYKGDNYTAFSKIGENRTLDYGIRADEPAFEKLIRSLRNAANNPNDKDALRASLTLVQDVTQKDLPNLISGIGIKVAQTERIQNIHEQNALVLQNTISEFKDTNIIDASAQLSQQNNILQASFSSFAKINQISLVNFI
jgi:flagellar hook-associated protein 3 FlgL